jgi:PTH2 family peptidyl-tRNA hydrolase
MQYHLDDDLAAILNERKRTMAEFLPDYRPLNMYVIYRSDLEMSAAKLAAQCGHAFVNAYEKALRARPEITSAYKGTGEGTKIVLQAKTLQTLIRAYRDIEAARLPHHLVIDRGHKMPPHFDGEPVITALGIGPVFRDEVETTMKRYSLPK